MGKWVKKKLGEIGDIITGSTPTTSKLDYWNGDYNFYSPADFTDNIYCDKTERTVTIEGLNVGRCIPENSIMVACIASIGKIAINKTKGITNQQINSIIPFDEFNYLFLYYLLLHKSSVIKNGAAQTTIPIINKEDFSNLEVTIPSSLSEQRRIASILLSADKVIDSTQKLIAKYKSIKQGMMEDLLKPKEGWKKVKLGECCEINPKTDTSKVLDDDIIVFVKMEDVSNDGFITSFNEKIYQSLQKKGFTVFQNDDVIFAKITPCMENGKGALVRGFDTKICMGSTEFHVIRACENISIDFIYQLTISKQFRLKAEMQMTGSAGQQRVPISFLEDYLFYIPDFSEQCRIASILSSIDKKIESEEKVLEKYKKIKKGLMEKLLNCE